MKIWNRSIELNKKLIFNLKTKENSYNQIFHDINQVNALLANEIKSETKEREFVVESLFKTLEDVSSTYGRKYKKWLKIELIYYYFIIICVNAREVKWLIELNYLV